MARYRMRMQGSFCFTVDATNEADAVERAKEFALKWTEGVDIEGASLDSHIRGESDPDLRGYFNEPGQDDYEEPQVEDIEELEDE